MIYEPSIGKNIWRSNISYLLVFSLIFRLFELETCYFDDIQTDRLVKYIEFSRHMLGKGSRECVESH